MLTEQQIETHWRQLHVPITKSICRRFGDGAGDHVGGCLYKALRSYDPARGNDKLASWVRIKTYNLVIETIREENGRKGTRRFDLHEKTQAMPEDFDIADNVTANIDDDFSHVLSLIHSLPPALCLQRWILLGRLLADFSDGDLQRIIHAPKDEIRRTGAAIHKSIPVDRLPALIRRPHRKTTARVPTPN